MFAQFTRKARDSFPVAVDWSAVDVFAAAEITGCTAAADPDDLTLGAVAVADNVATFRVSGGTAGPFYTIALTATNVTDTKGADLGCDTV